MSLKLQSGFTFDYDNLFGEGKVTAADLKACEPELKKAHEAMKTMRKTGVIRGHLSKDGTPELVLFSQLPYVEDGHLNSPKSMADRSSLTVLFMERIIRCIAAMSLASSSPSPSTNPST